MSGPFALPMVFQGPGASVLLGNQIRCLLVFFSIVSIRQSPEKKVVRAADERNDYMSRTFLKGGV